MENNTSQSEQPIQSIQQPLNPSEKPRHSSYTPKILLVGILLILFTIVGIGGYVLGTKKQSLPQSLSHSTPTITVIPSAIVPTATPTQTEIQTSSWKTYYDPILDLILQYPPDWKITTGTYPGDIGLSAGCKYIASQGFLKNPSTCNDTAIQSLSPGLTITAPNKDRIQFGGPTSGLGGGGCDPADCEESTHTIEVRGKSYELTLFTFKPSKDNPTGTAFTTEFPELNIPTGAKSVWSNFQLSLDASDNETFSTELKILNSITYQP